MPPRPSSHGLANVQAPSTCAATNAAQGTHIEAHARGRCHREIGAHTHEEGSHQRDASRGCDQIPLHVTLRPNTHGMSRPAGLWDSAGASNLQQDIEMGLWLVQPRTATACGNRSPAHQASRVAWVPVAIGPCEAAPVLSCIHALHTCPGELRCWLRRTTHRISRQVAGTVQSLTPQVPPVSERMRVFTERM